MKFEYKWATKETGNYAIRRREGKGKKAGREIEPKKKEQTSNTHFFLKIEESDTDTKYNLLTKINPILKTITYDYVYKGTNKKALSKYLTQDNFDDLFKDIESHKDKTITIEITSPKKERRKRMGEGIKQVIKQFEELFGEKETEKLLKLSLKLKQKEEEKTQKKKEMNREIRKLETDIEKVKMEILPLMNAQMDKKTIRLIPGNEKIFIQADWFKKYVKISKVLAIEEEKRKGRNARQKKYRDKNK